jgi:hypothetical protein
MPNWCDNRVRVYGDEADLSAFKELVSNLNVEDADQRLFDFNKVLPMPKELEGTVAPVAKPDQQLIEKFGYDNWYDWRTANWGTKWNASEVEVVCDEGDMVEYNFATAWGPPNGVYLALANRFPNLGVEWLFDEPNCRTAGYLSVDEARVASSALVALITAVSRKKADEASTAELPAAQARI